jgi:branched-chain amino acid transport system permease protein
VVIAVPTLRLRGPFFALGMFAYAHILGLLVLNLERLTGGGSGLSGLPPLPGFSVGGVTADFLRSRAANYYVTLAAVWAVWGCSVVVRRSRFGLGLLAIAQDEDAARSLGVHTTLYKALALMLSAGTTALFGALFAHYIRFLTPSVAFAGYWSVFPMVASLFGGAGFAAGPLVGALGLGLVHEFVLAELLQRGALLLFGVLVVAVVIGMPGGLLGQARRWLAGARAR